MNYSEAVKLAEINNIHIEPHVIPLGLAWRIAGYTNIEVVRDITWSDVLVQTDLRLTEDNLDELSLLCSDEQLEYLVKKLGYRGVLIVVASTKQFDNCGLSCHAQHYAYLPDPEWSAVGTELGKLVDRVLASWREDKP